MENVIILADASVLIDFYHADPNLIKLFSNIYFKICVADSVFDEVVDTKEKEAKRLSLDIIESDISTTSPFW